MKLTAEVVQVYLERLVESLLAEARIDGPAEKERDSLYTNIFFLNEASRVVGDSGGEYEVEEQSHDAA